MKALEERDGPAAREALIGAIERGGEGILAYLGKRPLAVHSPPTPQTVDLP